MSNSPCPVCREEVSLPAHASPSATVRCPLCQEVYELSRVLNKMPPALIVVSDHGAGGDRQGAPYSLSSDRGGGFSYGESAAASQSFVPAFQFEQSTGGPASESAPSPALRASQPRRQKKQKSAIWEIIKVAGGGVIGIAGALLIMWWGLDRDPLEFGPSVYKVLPWIVPQKFSGVAPSDSTTAMTQDNADEEPSNNIDAAPKTLGTELDSSVVPWEKNGNEDNETKSTGDDSSTNSSSGNNSSTNNGSSTTNNKAPSTTAKLEPVGIRNAGFVAASDLIGALDDYKIAAGQWIDARKNTDADEISRADAVFFASLARFGEIVAYADDTDPEIQMQTETMVKYLGSLKTKDSEYGSLKFIADSASDWLNEPASRTNAGIMLAGTVLSVKPHGRIFESRVQLANESKEIVIVYHLKKPAGDYVSKAQVMVLGVIVDQPSENLIGFEGTDPELICSARAIVYAMADSPDGSTPDASDLPVPTIDVPSIKIPSIEFPSSTTPSTETPSNKPKSDPSDAPPVAPSDTPPPAAPSETPPPAAPSDTPAAASPDASPDGAGSAAIDK